MAFHLISTSSFAPFINRGWILHQNVCCLFPVSSPSPPRLCPPWTTAPRPPLLRLTAPSSCRPTAPNPPVRAQTPPRISPYPPLPSWRMMGAATLMLTLKRCWKEFLHHPSRQWLSFQGVRRQDVALDWTPPPLTHRQLHSSGTGRWSWPCPQDRVETAVRS